VQLVPRLGSLSRYRPAYLAVLGYVEAQMMLDLHWATAPKGINHRLSLP
jgi:hypothetical protein